MNERQTRSAAKEQQTISSKMNGKRSAAKEQQTISSKMNGKRSAAKRPSK